MIGIHRRSSTAAFLPLLWIGCTAATVSGDVGFSIQPAEVRVAQGQEFTTELKIAAWDNGIGAYALSFLYDPDVVQLLEVSVTEGTVLQGDVYVDTSEPGVMYLIAFHGMNVDTNPTELTLASMVWLAHGPRGDSSNLEVVPESVVDSSWNPVEVQVWPSIVNITDTSADEEQQMDPSPAPVVSCGAGGAGSVVLGLALLLGFGSIRVAKPRRWARRRFD